MLNFLFNSHSLVGKLLCSVIYCIIYDSLFMNFVYKFFYYMGVDYIVMNSQKFLLWILLSTIPFLFYKGIDTLASFFVLFLYIFVYIPFIHALFVMWGLSTFMVYSYALAAFFLFVVYFSSGANWCIFKQLVAKPSIPFKWIEFSTIFLSIVFIFFMRERLQFVNIFTQSQLLYELREKNAESSADFGLIFYLQGWLFGGFYPFLLVCYLRQKQRLKSIVILMGYVILFMADMQKMTFFMPYLIIGFYFLIRLNEKGFSNRIHSILTYSLIITSLIIIAFQDNELVFTIAAILLLRTICVAGWLTQFYMRFFINNPYTHYSHINIVNAITNEYPYSTSLGTAVAYGGQNANANFLLTDGVAAWGIIGLIAIGLFFFVLLHFINAISYRYKKTDLLVIFLPTLSYLLNTSIFTTMLSNGMLILLVLIIGSKSPLITPEYQQT